MIGRAGVLAAVLVAASAVAAQAQTPPEGQAAAPRPSVITMPQWMTPPSVEFPAAAMSQGITRGRAGIDCGVQRDGRLVDCHITAEQPAGLGFGDALMKAAGEARLHPASVAHAAADARVRFAANFILQ